MGSGASSAKAPKAPAGNEPPVAETPTVDSRLPYPNFRELYTLKNYWKTVKRNDSECAKQMVAR